jgi:hypothetical protein
MSCRNPAKGALCIKIARTRVEIAIAPMLIQ